jgi:hypothetical protein
MNKRTSLPRIEAKISRLTREITDIDRYFYGLNENDDRSLYAGMLNGNETT